MDEDRKSQKGFSVKTRKRTKLLKTKEERYASKNIPPLTA